jgi:uncharacterized protein YecT (DUF1311 family)
LPFGRNQRYAVFGFDKLPDPIGLAPLTLTERALARLPKLSEERKGVLLEAQRAWIRFRDTNCAFWDDPTGGQSAAVTAKECILTMTADRASELELANDQ